MTLMVRLSFQQTGEVLMPQDMKKAQIYSGKKICFENEEITEIKKFDKQGLGISSKTKLCNYNCFDYNILYITNIPNHPRSEASWI